MNGLTKHVGIALLLTCLTPITLAQLTSFAREADLAVVARPVGVRAVSLGSEVDLIVVRTLKGSPLDGSAITVTLADVPPSPAGFNRGCAIWFLQVDKQAGKTRAISQSNGGPFLSTYTLRLASCAALQVQSYRVNATPADKILSEVVESAERGAQPVQLFGWLAESHSVIAEQAMRRFAGSPSLELRCVSFALGIQKGDVKSLARGEREMMNSPKGNHLVPLMMAIWNFTNPDGVAVLGRLATNSSVRAANYAASEALRLIHNPASLAILYLLLDSPEKAIRENAVMGFTLFRLGMPPALRGQAFDRTLMDAANPGKIIAPQDREGLHLGQFKSHDQETQLINFYKSWWPKNERLLSGGAH